MAKIKLSVTKQHEGDKYKFKDGVAKVPGLLISKKPVYITLSEFKELTQINSCNSAN